MMRAAAKNHAWVAIVTSPAQYDDVLAELHEQGAVSADTRRVLALEAFAHTAAYDAAIVEWLDRRRGAAAAPARRARTRRRAVALRREPAPAAARYREVGTTSWWDTVEQHSGVALSYLNLYDADAAWRLAHDLGNDAVCAIIKHANPCGVSVAGDLATAYRRAFECDERSAFGGIVAFNRPIDAATVELMVEGPQADLVIAPGYDDGVVETLRKKRKNTRLLEAAPPEPVTRELPPDHGRVPGAGRRTTTRRIAATGEWSPSARPPSRSGPTPSWPGASSAT